MKIENKETSARTVTRQEFIAALLALKKQDIERDSATQDWYTPDETAPVHGYIWNVADVAGISLEYVRDYVHGRPTEDNPSPEIMTYVSDQTGLSICDGLTICGNVCGTRVLDEDFRTIRRAELEELVEEFCPQIMQLDESVINVNAPYGSVAA